MRYCACCIRLFLLLIGVAWSPGGAAEVTLAWDAPPSGGSSPTASRLYQTRAGECVLNAAQYTQLGPDIPFPATQVTITALEEGGSYCWLVRFVDSAGLVGLPSYVIGYVVPRLPAPPPQHLRIPGAP